MPFSDHFSLRRPKSRNTTRGLPVVGGNSSATTSAPAVPAHGYYTQQSQHSAYNGQSGNDQYGSTHFDQYAQLGATQGYNQYNQYNQPAANQNPYNTGTYGAPAPHSQLHQGTSTGNSKPGTPSPYKRSARNTPNNSSTNLASGYGPGRYADVNTVAPLRDDVEQVEREHHAAQDEYKRNHPNGPGTVCGNMRRNDPGNKYGHGCCNWAVKDSHGNFVVSGSGLGT